MSQQDSLEALRAEIVKLAEQVKKNSAAIANTGRHVLSLQIEKERASLQHLDLKTEHDESSEDEAGQVKSGDIMNAEDIVQLVTELQGQLDILDEKSVRRNANAFALDDNHHIAPLPGRDGNVPLTTKESLSDEAENDNIPKGFPNTLGEFKKQSESQVQKWLLWYELLPPDEAELQDILNAAGTSLGQLGIEKSAEVKALSSSQQELNANYDTLARFLGLRTRRSKGVW
jgi:hypothetical protein